MQDERELFADEQAYIVWKRQQDAEAKAAARSAAQAQVKRRKVKYSDRIRRALATIARRRRLSAIYADTERYEAYKARNRRVLGAWRNRNRERVRENWRRMYRSHAEDRRLRTRVWYQDHKDYRREYDKAYREAHIDEIRAYDRARSKDPKRLQRNRDYQAAHRDEIAARKRAAYAAKKAAQSHEG